MTREEAKAKLEDVAKNMLWGCGDYSEALELAINALEQKPKTDTWSIKEVADALERHGLFEQEPYEDCISRQAVLDLINTDWKYEGLETYVADLPSVTPQEPKTDILDKIRAEIANIEICGQIDSRTSFIRTGEQVKDMTIEIIDKYR